MLSTIKNQAKHLIYLAHDRLTHKMPGPPRHICIAGKLRSCTSCAVCLDGSKGFNELGREIGAANPTTLTQRLERLESLGLVSKTVCSVMPLKSSYSLTPAGTALEKVN